MKIARAETAPARTAVFLVPEGIVNRQDVLRVISRPRMQAMERHPDLGAKNAALSVADGKATVHFFQGLPDGALDVDGALVCINSCVCVLSVARRTWGMLNTGNVIDVVMGTETFSFEEVPA